MKITSFTLCILVLMWAPDTVIAQAPPAVDPVRLMQLVEKQNSPPDEMVRLSMRLIDSGGKTSQRSAVFYRRQKEAGSTEDMKLIRFDSPPELNGSAVLTLENATRADDQWLYLPAYRTSRKIPPGNRSDRYMGTDFYYEDVSDDKISQYRYSIVGQEKIGDRSYLLVSQAAESQEAQRESAYGRKLQWVDPERYVVARIDYFDRQGTLIKRFEASQPIQVTGRWRWNATVMSDLRLGHKTEIDYSDRKIDQGVDAALFTVRSLERAK
jgi:outer membrane lipoprotein-sorting protein